MGTTKWQCLQRKLAVERKRNMWSRRARRETLLAVAFERKLVLPLLLPIHTAPTTLLIRLLLASHPPSPLGKAMVSLRYENLTCNFEIEVEVKKGKKPKKGRRGADPYKHWNSEFFMTLNKIS